MIEWRIIGVFSKPNLETMLDEIYGIQWNVQTNDYSNPDFPKYAQLSGSFAFSQPREKTPNVTEDNIIGWMVSEGFKKDEIENQLLTML